MIILFSFSSILRNLHIIRFSFNLASWYCRVESLFLDSDHSCYRKNYIFSFLLSCIVFCKLTSQLVSFPFPFYQLVLLVGAKLQHVIATLALENAGLTEYPSGVKLRPRDELFWFNKPELLLSLIHFILFQVCKKLY